MPIPKPLLFLIIGFLIYLVTLDPGEAGQNANVFLDWVGDVFGGILDFIDGIVSNDDPSPPATTSGADGVLE